MSQETLTIDHVPGSSFQATVEGQRSAAEYRLENGVMHMTHTVVPPALEGRGIAGKLVAAAFDYAKAHGFKINPLCAYVIEYMKRHPETEALRA